MSRQVTITLSDGTPHTGTLDPDGFLLLPRGKKPAEPWWSRCEADPQGQSDKPHGLSPIAVPVPCGGWEWHDDEWFRIRPLPGESWESIAPQQPATPKRDYSEWVEGSWFDIRPNDFEQDKYETEFEWGGEWLVELNPDIAGWHVMRVRLRRPPRQPARDYTNWQEGMGDSAKPEDYDRCPEAYEVEYLTGGNVWRKILDPCWIAHAAYRVRKRPAAARDYTNWQEGLGSEAKPEDYDPERYEAEVWDGERWQSYGKFAAPSWHFDFRYRVRLRQQEVPLCSTDVSWSQPQRKTNSCGLSFKQLREANTERARQWRKGAARPPLTFTVMELCGEVGEFANAIKKLERYKMGMAGGSNDLTNAIQELGDLIICADLAAEELGIDLGAAVAAKFNATSRKHGFTTMLPEEES